MKKLKSLIYKYGYYFALGYWYVRRPVTQGVKCIVINSGHMLLVQHAYGANSLTMIGGGVKENETLEQAVIREGLEEVGLVLENPRKIGEIYSDSEFKKDTVHVFIADSNSRSVILSDGEITLAQWFTYQTIPKNLSPLTQQFLSLARPYITYIKS